jgi:tetratricopeptide (TPR) repeat protein
MIDGSVFDAGDALRLAMNEENDYLVAIHYGLRAIYCTFCGDYVGAYKATQTLKRYYKTALITMTDFLEGVSVLALARTLRGRSRWKHTAVGRNALKFLKRYAARCPANFRTKQYLVQAKLEAIRGEPTQALSLYNQAIEAAKAEQMKHKEGLAYERLAHYHCYLGHSQAAIPFFTFAREAYARWGAQVLVDQMDELIRQTESQSAGKVLQ